MNQMINARRTNYSNEGQQNNIQRWLSLLVVIVSLFGCAIVHAADNAEELRINEPRTSEPTGNEGKQCTWSCLKWSKLCNVDPRGVY